MVKLNTETHFEEQQEFRTGHTNWCSCEKCKAMLTDEESLCCRDTNDIPDNYFQGLHKPSNIYSLCCIFLGGKNNYKKKQCQGRIQDILYVSQNFRHARGGCDAVGGALEQLGVWRCTGFGVCKLGNKDVVHPKNVNPLSYSQATLKGHGLREDDICKAFSNLVRRKLADKAELKWPPTPEELISNLEKSKPISCIYNAISWSVNPKNLKGLNGYVETVSIQQAERIAAISQCWEDLITKTRSPTAAAVSLTLHRITGSKEATCLLHKCGMGISYSDVRLLTNNWAKNITLSHKGMLPKGFTPGKIVSM